MSHSKNTWTALLIRCQSAEADKIRHAAKQERRTLSGYVLHAVLQRLAVQEKVRRTVLRWAEKAAFNAEKSVKRNLQLPLGESSPLHRSGRPADELR
jgi:hypothetical protein